jgi:SAM-dependent methyltransferase
MLGAAFGYVARVTNAAPIRLTSAALRRRELARSFLQDDSAVLEIGPFDSPAFIKDRGDNVRYLDWFSADELFEQHKDNPKRLVSNIVEVDYVIKSHHFAGQIDDRFDMIFAAHVVEHVADMIGWLQQLESLLLPGGVVFLAVPDRRYTFDYHRRTTVVLDVIRAHEEGLTRPDKWQLADAMYHHTRVDTAAIWDGQEPPPFRPRRSLRDVLLAAHEAAKEYADTHCWVFTDQSFAELVGELNEAGLTRFNVKRMDAPAPGTNEFSVFLELPSDTASEVQPPRRSARSRLAGVRATWLSARPLRS